MVGLTTEEHDAIARVDEMPMLDQVTRWSAVNSGTGNLAGLASMADLLADAFSALPGEIALLEPAPAERVDADGRVASVETRA